MGPTHTAGFELRRLGRGSTQNCRVRPRLLGFFGPGCHFPEARREDAHRTDGGISIAHARTHPGCVAIIGCVFQTRGGGNCANALTAAARLGAQTYLVTKLGKDSIGDQIVSELEKDGVNTQFVLRDDGQSAFGYMIVDKKGEPASTTPVAFDQIGGCNVSKLPLNQVPAHAACLQPCTRPL